jgi:YNFM family putative membrane transporter
VAKLDKATAATMLAGMCTFLGVYCTQPLLPLLRRLFQASELEVSLTVSATIFAVALTAPVIGMIAERRGRKKVIVPSLFLLTIPTALAATSSSLRVLIFWRFAQGLFVPGVIAVMLAYVNEEWAGRGVGHAMSSYVTGTVIGGFLGRFISGLVATHWHWRASFLVLAAINLLGAVLCAHGCRRQRIS